MANEVTIIIKGNSKQAQTALKNVTKQMQKTGKAAKSQKGLLTKLRGSWLGITAAVAGVGIAFKKIIDLSNRQEDAERRLNQVLESTQHAAGLTADEVLNLASSLQKVTTFGDEAIIEGQNLLLTFTKIGEDVFPQATETMLDMSTALGQDMKSSAIQLGKALNDPVLGVAALRRVGVQLTKQQEDMIKSFVKTGDIASAQKIILNELATQMGGTSRAAAETFSGALKQIGNRMGDILEDAGDLIKIGLEPLIDMFNELTDTKGDIDLLAGAFKILATVILTIGTAIKAIVDGIAVLVNGFKRGVDQMIGFWNTYKTEGLDKARQGYAEFAAETRQQTYEMFNGMQGDGEKFLNRIQKIWKDSEKAAKTSTKSMAKDNKSATDSMQQDSNNLLNRFMDNAKKTETIFTDSYAAIKEVTSTAIDSIVDSFDDMDNSFGKVLKAMIKSFADMISGQLKIEAGKRFAQGVAALTNPFTAWAAPGHFGAAAGLTAAAAAAKILGNAVANSMVSAAEGADFITNGEQLLKVGDNPSGRERVTVTPEEQGLGGGIIIENMTVQANDPQEFGVAMQQFALQTGTRGMRR